MERLNEEVSTLIVVEHHLLNAAGAIRLAEHRLGGYGRLRDDLREILRALEGTVELTRKTKQTMLKEWQSQVDRSAA